MRRLLPALALFLAACQTDSVASQTAALSLTPESLARHPMEMRRFDTGDEKLILSASAGLLQDLGFTIDEVASGAGLVSGAKDRDAVETGQVAGAVFLAALAQALGNKSAQAVYDQRQKIRISVVTRPSADHRAVVTQMTVQREVWNNFGKLAHVDTLDDVVMYRDFFDRLSQAVFLEAHQI